MRKTTDCRPEKGDGSGSNGSGAVEAKVPSFYKMVSNPGLHRLSLPHEFIRGYGHNLPDSVSLKVPNGLVWEVGLIHSNGEAWLHRGWRRFQEYYSLEFGHVLIFNYVGISRFEVHIFDTTDTEIEYSCYDSRERDTGINQLVAITEVVESDSDDSVVFLEEVLAGEKAGRKHQDVVQVRDNNPTLTWEMKRTMQESDGLYPEKLRRSYRGKQVCSSPAKKDPRFLDSSPSYGYDVDEHDEGTEPKHPDEKQVQQQAGDGNNRFKAYTRAVAFMSEKPNWNLFAIVVLHPSYVQHSVMGNSSIVLVFKGKTWLVRYVRGQRDRATLTSGWRKFVEDNDLKVGDACVFEVSRRINLEWDVIIFRG